MEQNLQSSDGIHWEPAEPVPYYPSIWERFMCFIGKHHYHDVVTYYVRNNGIDIWKCFKCNKVK